VFFNNSTEKSQIDTMFVIYGDGTQEVVLGGVDLVHTYANPGIYDINITYISTLGCMTTGSHPAIANVIPNPEADFTMSANPTTFFETIIGMQDFSTGNVDTWEWYSPLSTPTTSTQNNPTFTFPEGVTGTYPISLIVTTLEGCMDTITKNLTVNSDILFFAPNSFTPDGDEFNQTWSVTMEGIDVFDFDLFIFNRWGEIIWESHDPKGEWDGTYQGEIAKSGVYTWIIRTKDAINDKKYEFNGFINIVR
jgi:gliding motility-associated-like protein